jgi:hypothetical protein
VNTDGVGANDQEPTRGALSPELEARVLATTDLDTLTTLVTALGAAENLEAARAALAAL